MSASDTSLPVSRSPMERTAYSAALVTAGGAVLCGVCCVLPFALPAVAVAFSGGALAWIASAYSGSTVVALTTVAAAWAWVITQSIRAKKRPARSTLSGMGLATAVLALALMWARIGPLGR